MVYGLHRVSLNKDRQDYIHTDKCIYRYTVYTQHVMTVEKILQTLT